MEKETINEIIQKVSEMYRCKMKEAKEMSDNYDDAVNEINNSEITHKRHLELESRLSILSGETNNLYNVAEGISDVREMLFELLEQS